MRARTSPHGTQFGPYTVLDLHELPEDGKGFELEDGWLIDADKPVTVSFDPAVLLDF
jgi:hypothetical protein